MLKALYDYAKEHDLAETPGYVKEHIRAYICLTDANPPYTGLYVCGRDETALCPDVGSRKKGPSVSRILYESASVLFAAFPETPEEKEKQRNKRRKLDFFLRTLRLAAETDSALELCLRVLESPETIDTIRADLKREKIKDAEFLSFMIDHRSILEREKVRRWWDSSRKAILAEIGGAKTRKAKNSGREQESLCLITGERTVPVRTLPLLKGLTKKDVPLFGFDKDAFRSYELAQSANAPVSESAISAVTFALNSLIRDAPGPVGGMLFIHWYSRDVRDIIAEELVNGEDSEDTEGEEGKSGRKARHRANPKGETKKANKLVQSVWTGEGASLNPNTLYYILLLSGVGGRVMIRRFEEGTYATLEANLKQWKADLRLCNPAGTAPLKHFKLAARLYRLLSFGESRDKPWEKTGGISSLIPGIIHAIVQNEPLPDTVAARALAYLRSQMLSNPSNEEGGNTRISPDGMAVQWLKVWLIRNNKEDLTDVYNYENPSIAYHCGGLMALYASIQESALGDVDANVVQRYYSSASQTPALAFGQLSRLAVYHLGKMEKGLAFWYQQKIENVVSAIPGNTFPVTLDLRGQSSFALGYYQMWAAIRTPKDEKIVTNDSASDDSKN